MHAYKISLPDNGQQLLVFYLAMEEYVAQHIDTLLPIGENGAREGFFLWQVPPTVIFGRNQVMEAEVNLEYIHENHVHLFRRKSGGGCVYSDQGNIMLSYITDHTDVSATFDVFLQEVASMLQSLGLDASRSGRNDILVGGKKVSGNSLFLLPHAGIVHGTLLYDTDFEALVQAITPSSAKVSSKGVSSVRQHVTNVKDELQKKGIDSDIGSFKDYILRYFCGGRPHFPEGGTGRRPDFPEGEMRELVLSPEDVRQIQEIEATYLDPDFLKGRNHAYTLEFSGRIEQVGEVKLEIKMDSDYIEQCWLKGDIFPLQDKVDEALTGRLKGCQLTEEAIGSALEGWPLEQFILHLHKEDLLKIIFPG